MGLNHFDILGIKPSPIINALELKKAFITKQRLVHPDTGVDTDDSQDLNAAYEILRTEEGALKSFLLMFVSEEELNKNLLPADFLMEMMELSDIIEDSRVSGGVNDKQEAEKSISNLKSKLEIEKQNLFSENSINIENSSNAISQINPWIVWYQKSRYYSRLRKNLDGFEEF
jgi:curved DNA-binding protein CbpA